MLGVDRIVGEAYGRRFALVADRSTLASAAAGFPYGWRPSGGEPERTWQIPAPDGSDGEPLGDGGSAESLVSLVTSEIELWVAEHAEGLIFVHAGVVAFGGRAILLPGLTRAGKSTLVAALVRAGATYYSDEFAPIDAAGRVHAYRRIPQQRADSPATAWQVDLSGAAPPPVPVGLVAHLNHQPGAPTELIVMPAAAAVLAVLANTVPARARPAEALDVIAVAVRDAVCLKGIRGEAETAAPLLIEHLSPT